MSSSQSRTQKARKSRRNLLFERLMMAIASVNLGLVCFDITYISARSFYLYQLPSLTRLYDPVKGIEPERDTQKYLDTAKQLEEQLAATGLQSPEVLRSLQRMRALSRRMIEEDPFQGANKSGTWVKIKNRMRDRMDNESVHEAFAAFWSEPHLSKAGWQQELGFFNTRLRPLMATNYYRPIGENGEPINYFWLIDTPFVVLFGLEFLARTYHLSRRYKSLRWLDALLWRWYDLFLFIPFWRWLRLISLTTRLHQARLVDLEWVMDQANQGLAANLAGELSEVIVLRVLNQFQDLVRRGDLAKWLFHPEIRRAYVDLNNVNEVEAIGALLLKLTVHDVLPQVQPDLEALLRHTIAQLLQQSPAYQGLQQIPGLRDVPTQLTEKLVSDITQSAYKTLVAGLEDPIGAQLSRQLVEHFVTALESQVSSPANMQQIQDLLLGLLEDVKFSYIKYIESSDLEAVLEETRQLRMVDDR